MTELLNQALTLTGWGMGMTFLALGALALAMNFMTLLFKDKTEIVHDEWAVTPEEDNVESDVDGAAKSVHNQRDMKNLDLVNGRNDQNIAAAAAVAVAMALAQELPRQQKQSTDIQTESAWDYFIRGRHLSQRSRYEQLKLRR
jgi:Na+-transporting methylmalonyl-CoA/oxaloacetate decarboxylase gamma subunit